MTNPDRLRDERLRRLDEGRNVALAKLRARGAWTARERIDRLVDPGSFLEYGMLAAMGALLAAPVLGAAVTDAGAEDAPTAFQAVAAADAFRITVAAPGLSVVNTLFDLAAPTAQASVNGVGARTLVSRARIRGGRRRATMAVGESRYADRGDGCHPRGSGLRRSDAATQRQGARDRSRRGVDPPFPALFAARTSLRAAAVGAVDPAARPYRLRRREAPSR